MINNLERNGERKSAPLKTVAGAPDKPLIIGDIEIPCYVLEDETRVISQRGIYRGMGTTGGGSENTSVDAAQMPRFARSKWLQPFLTPQLKETLASPIEFSTQFGKLAYGYPAESLVELCEAILQARDSKAASSQQTSIVVQADLIMRGLARVGINALIDEATGYEEIRVKRALAHILEMFIAKEIQPWMKTYPIEFYEQICRLKRWPKEYAISRPSVVGHYTNDIIYERLAPGVLKELRARNPAQPDGTRKHKHHQLLTPNHGHIALQNHLAAVISLMRISKTWQGFKRHLTKAHPKHNEQLFLEFDSE